MLAGSSSSPSASSTESSSAARVRAYLTETARLLEALPIDQIAGLAEELSRARTEDRSVLVFGNGGSASTASHIACDLTKNAVVDGLPRLRVIAVGDAQATMTAYANDNGYESTFEEAIRTFGRPQDLAIAVSVSGSSPNVVAAVRLARQMGMRTIAVTGAPGGALASMVDRHILVPSATMECVEDAHLVINHALTVVLRSQPA